MLRMSDATRESLRDGQVITAFVRPAGEDHAAPATLNWSFETGATVRLVEPTDEWALEFNSVGHVMHLSVNEGEEYTMLDARVSGATADGRISKLNAYTLALGTHTDNDELWPAAKYSTANVSEWFGESGINVSYPDDADPFIRLEYRRPPAREVTIDAGKLVFAPELTSPGVVYAADWSISTRTTMHVAPVAPCTAAELNRSFAQPLRALTSFVSDRPDSLTIERLMNAQTQRETVIWRVAPQTEVRSWHVISDYLFRVRDADNIEALIGRWWALYEAVDPALGHFAQHLNAGSMYSPERLVVVIAALEAYGDIQHNTTDLRALRNQTGVASSVTGCTNAALDLLGPPGATSLIHRS